MDRDDNVMKVQLCSAQLVHEYPRPDKTPTVLERFGIILDMITYWEDIEDRGVVGGSNMETEEGGGRKLVRG